MKNQELLKNLQGLQKDLCRDIRHKLSVLGLVQTITKDVNSDSLEFTTIAKTIFEETFFVTDCSSKDEIAFLQSSIDWGQIYTQDLISLKEQREIQEITDDEIEVYGYE